MVDEFQDTNRLQLRLVEALRGPGTRLFCVGDEFQSIYGFRHADLDVSASGARGRAGRRRCGECRCAGTSARSRGHRRAANAVGEGCSSTPSSGCPSAPCRPRRAAGDDPAVELLLTARKAWAERGHRAGAATDAVRAGPDRRGPVPGRAAARPRRDGFERGDMVVLLRAYTHVAAFEDSLERAGLRPYVVGGRGYWSQQQVDDVGALLGRSPTRSTTRPARRARLAGLRGAPRHAVAAAPAAGRRPRVAMRWSGRRGAPRRPEADGAGAVEEPSEPSARATSRRPSGPTARLRAADRETARSRRDPPARGARRARRSVRLRHRGAVSRAGPATRTSAS